MEEVLVKNFIDKKTDVMYDKMQKKCSFNLFSMLFTSFYFMYRKMYLIGILIFIIECLALQLLQNITVGVVYIVLILLDIICGFLFYPLYKIHIEKKIKTIKKKETQEEEINRLSIKKGGTSIGSIFILPLIVFIGLGISLGTMMLDPSIRNTKSISASEFANKMTEKGYTVVNVNKQFSKYDHVKNVYIALDSSKKYQIEFYEFVNDAGANAFFNNCRTRFKESKQNGASEKGIDWENHSRYELTSNNKYMFIARIDNTAVFVEEDNTYKKDIKATLKTLGY